MSGTLTVQNIQGPSSGANANKIIIPSGQTFDASAGTVVPSAGQLVNYVQHVDTNSINFTSTSYATAYTIPTYTPVLTSSTVIHRFNVVMRSANDSYDARCKLKILRNGSAVITETEIFGYDYGGGGIWLKMPYTQVISYSNTDGSNITAEVQIGVVNSAASCLYNSTEGTPGAVTQSVYEIMEIAQ